MCGEDTPSDARFALMGALGAGGAADAVLNMPFVWRGMVVVSPVSAVRRGAAMFRGRLPGAYASKGRTCGMRLVTRGPVDAPAAVFGARECRLVPGVSAPVSVLSASIFGPLNGLRPCCCWPAKVALLPPQSHPPVYREYAQEWLSFTTSGRDTGGGETALDKECSGPDAVYKRLPR